MAGAAAASLGPVGSGPGVTRWGEGLRAWGECQRFLAGGLAYWPCSPPFCPFCRRKTGPSAFLPTPTSLLPASSGFGRHSSWGLESFLLSSEVTAFCLQAKYMVRRVSWWTCTALARAWGSRPLLCPDMWLPSPLKRKNERSPSWWTELPLTLPPPLGCQFPYQSRENPNPDLGWQAPGHQIGQSSFPSTQRKLRGSGTRGWSKKEASLIPGLTCHALCPLGGIVPGKPPSGHSRQVLELRRSVCIVHKCGTAGTSRSGAHPLWNGCHPKGHSNGMVGWCPGKIGRWGAPGWADGMADNKEQDYHYEYGWAGRPTHEKADTKPPLS